MLNQYFIQITLEGLSLGFVIGMVLVSISFYAYLIYEKKQNKREKIDDFSPLRVLENYEGMAFSCLINEEWTMTYVSSNAYKIFGYTSDEILQGKHITYSDIIHPKFRNFVRDKYIEAIHNHQDIQLEYMIIDKDNQEKWVREDGHIIYDSLGRPLAIDGFIYGIDFYKRMLADNNQYKAKYQSLFEDLDFPIVVIQENQIIDINHSAINFFRASSKDQILKMKPIEMIDESYHDLFKSRFARLQETKTSNLSTLYKLKRFDGTSVIANIEGVPFFEDGQMFVNVLILEKDDERAFSQRLLKTERRNRDLILYMHEGLAVFQPIPDELDAKLVYANMKFSDLLYDQFKNLTYHKFSNLFDLLIKENYQEIFNHQDEKPLVKEIYQPTSKKYLQCLFYYNNEKELIVQMTDVTKEKELIRKYQEEKQTLDEILEATDTMIWTWDRSKNKLIYEKRTFDILGYDYDDQEITNPEKIMNYFHPDDRTILYQQLTSYFKCEIPYFSVEVRIRDAMGNYRWWMVRGKAVQLVDNIPLIISGTYQDITHHKLKDEEIKFLSMHDQLTKLYNLRAYHEKMDELDQDKFLPISLAIIDVNGLKVFNDALSHSVGDDLLVKTSNVMSSFAKESDVLARIGGDEFVMIMPNTPIEHAETRFKLIEEALSEERVANIPISISYGVEVKFNQRFTLHQIKDMADSKMYQQKFSGKDTRLEILKSIRHEFFKQNPFEGKVVNKVHELSMKLSHYLDLDPETRSVIEIASQYYNIGIFSIRNEIFNEERKFEKYAEIEYRKHVENGYRIILATYRNERIAMAILHHHEKFNGLGYPAKLEGHKIPLASRMISIAATYSRRMLLGESKENVFSYLEEEKNISFDPELVDDFIGMIKSEA
ncbi:PAS domain-containing protein [Hujiaoplasma nucleasis]|uniref:PAS domain-containing protein n=1 Tax=Hujiaoplasma nucleasis TaxID=2725268 RepID=A0A7L6N3H3_9MOLU|nr:PAS domain-containing protein [Hujiaoplasma nucleasis]QLY39787.1 PAS domain-containing protein [Hujiaoplasma nucleasis]